MLTARHEQILKAVHFYRYLTAIDICHLFYSPTSITTVRELLRKLTAEKLLYRFKMPSSSVGNSEQVYTLGSKGREVLTALGYVVDWYFRPSKAMALTYGQLTHALILTRVLISAQTWADSAKLEVRIRTSYELSKMKKVSVIPDAWVCLAKEDRAYPFMIEIDRGTAYQIRFKEHIKNRIEFIGSGEYEKIFGIDAATVLYLTTGEKPHYALSRAGVMERWCNEVLSEMKLESWGRVFRFLPVSLKSIYKKSFAEELLWWEEKPPQWSVPNR